MHWQREPDFINKPAHLISSYLTKTNHGEMFDTPSKSNAPTKITRLFDSLYELSPIWYLQQK
jgi:hypothetical protein